MQAIDERAAEFFRRSYTVVDGLWFVKVEEELGFDAALEIDNEVWKVLPKIQARMLKAMTGADRGLAALEECLTTKLRWEGHVLEAALSDDERELDIMIGECPWYDAMVKSGREQLAERVGRVICNSEFGTWAAEFGDDIRFELRGLVCGGAPSCVLHFEKRAGP